MSLKVYVAAPWVAKDQALVAKQAFETAGIEVTARWITRDTPADISARYNAGETNPADDQHLTEEAINDVEDVIKADLFVILNLDKSEGKATEMGMAYALGMPIILVGQRTRNIFYHLPHVFRADSVEKAIEGILLAEQKGQEVELAAAPEGPVN